MNTDEVYRSSVVIRVYLSFQSIHKLHAMIGSA